MNLFTLAALVVFIVAAVAAFFTTATVMFVLGLLAVGLACMTLAGVFAWNVGGNRVG